MATQTLDKGRGSSVKTKARPAATRGQDIRLPPEQLVELLGHLKGATSVELKIMVPDDQRGALRLLGFDPVEAQPRQIFFFDTPDLKLNEAGLIVRARRSGGGKGDTVVKLRPVDPATINAELRLDPAFKIEVDAMPGGFVTSGSATGRCTAQGVFDAIDGKVPLSSLFNKNQRQFYSAHVPEGVGMNDLVPLGPTFMLRLRQQPKKFDRPITVELWLYPDGSRILEMSTKGDPSEAFQLAAEFRAFLTDCGISAAVKTVTKTSTALAYFSKRLNPKPAP